ncbi:hypothetical protein EXS74_00675 [Candidatus Woesearchaeota archaeon]|nr:hypothetical protein [Candidatus Woesearchaeota archaeon]
MKVAPYLLPLLFSSTSCLPTYSSEKDSLGSIKTLEVSFPPYSWGLSWEQMKDLRHLSSQLPSGTTVSLESCATKDGNGEHFRKQRTTAVEYFLVQGNPLDVLVSLCDKPDQEKAKTVYVSVN